MKAQGPLGAKEIARLSGITPAAASPHLKILKQAGLVRSERQGHWIPYAINVEVLESIASRLTQVCTCGCQGTGNWKAQELAKAGVEALKQYEKDLQDELRVLRERIKELESK